MPIPKIKKPRRAVGFDVETTSLDRFKAKIFSVSLTEEDGTVEILRFDGKDGSDPKKNRAKFAAFCADPSIIKVAHGLSYDYTVTLENGFKFHPDSEFHCTVMMSRCLRNLHPDHSLDALAWELFGWPRENDKEVAKIGRKLGYHNVPVGMMNEYQDDDGKRGMLLYLTFLPEISASPAMYADYLEEVELIKTTYWTEKFGIHLKVENCLALIEWMEEELEQVRKETWKMFREYINWNADEQVARVLFEQLKFPVIEMTDSGKPSTDKDVLFALREKFPHPVYELIFRTRSYTVGISTIRGYMEKADENGIIRTTFNTNGAGTGRQTSTNPNVQNFQKDTGAKNPYPVPARKCFGPRPGYTNFLSDYKGIEMRLIVAVVQEPELVQIIRDNGDVHLPAAEMFYGTMFTDPDHVFKRFLVTDSRLYRIYKDEKSDLGRDEADAKYLKIIRKQLRDAAKNAHFAIGYGAGASKLCVTLNLTPQEAMPGINAYRNRFPGVANFTRNIAQQVRKQGFVETVFGRKLNVDRATAYAGANYLIQCTGAQILKRAENRLLPYFRDELNFKVWVENKIHDELIFSFDNELLPRKKEILTRVASYMTTMPEIIVPLEVEWKRSVANWNEKKEDLLD